jgi:hypothetical protein
MSRLWTDDEIGQVVRLRDRKLSYEEIGAIIGRTGKSIADKMSRVGMRRPNWGNYNEAPPIGPDTLGDKAIRRNTAMLGKKTAAAIHRYANDNRLTLEQAVGRLLYGVPA